MCYTQKRSRIRKDFLDQMASPADIIIIGAGIIGSMTARFLSRFDLRILVIEKESEVCMGTSSSNAATVHSGHSAHPGTLKAEMNVRGNALWDNLAGELKFLFERRGDYVIGFGPGEMACLEELMHTARRNGVSGLEIISREEMLRREPCLSPQIGGALWSKNSGICSPCEATLSLIENAKANGVQLCLDTSVKRLLLNGNRVCGVLTDRGALYSRWVINAAGIFADEIMHSAGVRPDFQIKPRRGEFFLYEDPQLKIRNLLAPLPNPVTKGIAVKPTFSGPLLVGANSVLCDDKQDLAPSQSGLCEVWNGARRLIPGLDPQHCRYALVGLRAMGNAAARDPQVSYPNDFLVEMAEEVQGLINLAGIDSPGLAAAPAIALRVIELLGSAGERLVPKPDWNPTIKDRCITDQVRHRSRRIEQKKSQPLPDGIWQARSSK
jgi:glycerol-3-phosphate dehydrogenase